MSGSTFNKLADVNDMTPMKKYDAISSSHNHFLIR